ncbi:MAG: hypothetical protein B6U85_06090 [Desulfurococcales archaeon ex4484_42]|nr:MAG: hypothetical protein B6U85_06090 [Desulfurococcales archaeon ex4484_42]
MWRRHGGIRRHERFKVIDFSSNLNPLGPPNELIDAIKSCVSEEAYRFYPDPNYYELRKLLSRLYGVSNDELVVTNGASEALTLSLLTVMRFGINTLVVISPTFSDKELMITTKALGFKTLTSLMKDVGNKFILDCEEVVNLVKSKKAAILLSNPNNPTGTYVPLKVLKYIAESVREGYLIIDEAYLEFTNKSSATCLGMDNVLVVKTLTKIFATPGLRVGALISYNKEFIEVADYIRPTWNIDSLSECVYSKLLSGESFINYFISRTKQVISDWRSYMITKLRELGLVVYNSVANFVLVKHEDIPSSELHSRLLREGIAIRRADTFIGLSKYFSRLCVRSPDDVNKLVVALGRVLKCL